MKLRVLPVGSLGAFLLVMLLASVAHDVMIAHVGPFRRGYLLILGLYGMCWVLGLVYAGVAARMSEPLAELARRGRTGT